MIYKIRFTPTAEKVTRKWKKSNPNQYSKLVKVIQDIALHPREGIVKPEALVSGNGIQWSRHITAHDRIIYDIYEDVVTVLVIQVGGHYNDK